MNALRKLIALLLLVLSSTTAFAITDAQVFAYAESIYPSLFGGIPSAGQYQQYNYRYYPASGNYLAVDTAGEIFILGSYTGNVITSVGTVTAYADTITAWEAQTATANFNSPYSTSTTLTATGYFTGVTGLTSAPAIDSSTSSLSSTSILTTSFSRNWLNTSDNTPLNGQKNTLTLLYYVSADADYLKIMGNDSAGHSFYAGTSSNNAGYAFTCNVSGTNALGYFARPTCTSWGITVNKSTGAITFASTPVYDPYGAIGQTGTISGTTLSFTPIPASSAGITLSGMNPISGSPGTSVTITGTNFSTTPASNMVEFNGVPATVVTASATTLTVTVPNGATNGTVSVTTAGVMATSTGSFTVSGTIAAGGGGTTVGAIVFSVDYSASSNFCQDYFMGSIPSVLPPGSQLVNGCSITGLVGACTSSGFFKTYFYTGYPLAVAQRACSSQPNGVWSAN